VRRKGPASRRPQTPFDRDQGLAVVGEIDGAEIMAETARRTRRGGIIAVTPGKTRMRTPATAARHPGASNTADANREPPRIAGGDDDDDTTASRASRMPRRHEQFLGRLSEACSTNPLVLARRIGCVAPTSWHPRSTRAATLFAA